ncbi:HIT-type Zinc finger family protein [Tasmannia lanceolata]|uniref:HIT-type Zinc finger family protein n=1 Tax=Tasmannia lanceolata TaxID=3420 RepID=UPI0040628A73
MAEEKSVSSNPNPEKSSLCSECGLNSSKYKCPGCSIRSCSLPCVKSHKQRTNCNGKRDRTQFVSISQFDDKLLMSDFNLLEETKRVAERAQRMRGELCLNSKFKLPFRLRMLQDAARRRKICVLLLPCGMSMREKNRSSYVKKKNSIFWTIEWQFHSTDTVLIDHGVNETMSLYSIIESHLKTDLWNHQLRPFCKEQLDTLKFFVRKNAKGPKSPFCELNIKSPIGKQLADIVIVEYPVIHVFLPSHSYDFEVEKKTDTYSPNVGPAKPFDELPSPKGVPFREEEIEEGDTFFETQVLDLMKYAPPEPLDNFRIPNGFVLRDRGFEKEGQLSDVQLSTRVAEETKPVSYNELQTFTAEETGRYLSSNTRGVVGELDFDFEQDLRDAYSGLIGQVNPDDFLCLENEFGGGEELEGFPEDIEEGEIVEL